MIDEHFIRSAVEIRKEWVKIIRSLDNHQEQVEKAQRIIADKKADIDAFSKKDLKLKDVQVKEFVEKIFNEIEHQAILIESRIKPLNDDIERLKKEELRLYHKIRDNYPGLTDEDIKKEIYTHIRDIKP
jgi:predicted  nucleic acid-binding Zn-ribbon protein